MTQAFLEVPDPYAGIPMGRFGEPADIGNMVSFLLSDEAKYITGQEFVVDGGAIAH